MEYANKTKTQLINELKKLKKQINKLKKSEYERLHTEEELKETNMRLKTLIEAIPDVVYFKDSQGRNLVVNKAYEKLVGMRKKEILGRTDEQLLPPALAEECRKSDEEAIKKRKVIRIEEQSITRKGEKIFFETIKAPIFDNHNNLVGLVGVSRNITKRKQMEDALRESEVRFSTLFAGIGDSILVHDTKGIILDANEAACRRFGHSLKELKGISLRKLITMENAPRISQHVRKTLAEGTNTFETTFVSKNGITILCEVLEHPINYNGQKAILSVARDITERKRGEEHVKKSLMEKEVLLKEIHHRVKNNMQVICSLINLRARQVSDNAVFEMFRETSTRIKSMALVHEKLYRSSNLAEIDFADYIRDLTIHLYHSYGINPDAVKLKMNIKDVFLDINTAIPCALIINELITNSLRHAFPEGKKGKIEVDFHPDKKGRYLLIIKDNGIGLPEYLDFLNAKTLGMQLVTMLVDQLSGTIELVRSRGTSFLISFGKIK